MRSKSGKEPPPLSGTTEASVPQSESDVVDLTSDEVVTEAQKGDPSPFSSPIMHFPHKDGRPRRRVSFASDLSVKESLEMEMADGVIWALNICL
ncbi:hypothetical protein PHMEG_00014294 [Phytophthora megakarya]|uniref:Uncharacterized protein n=1 Tax=Phytophthora megakarya TaxID=4795 RepID=A0A225W4M2_9STRA|nr:hypothetical protein PHMEG_00014294 [Phytophthora megakarya]